MASRDSLSTGLQNLCISVRSGIEAHNKGWGVNQCLLRTSNNRTSFVLWVRIRRIVRYPSFFMRVVYDLTVSLCLHCLRDRIQFHQGWIRYRENNVFPADWLSGEPCYLHSRSWQTYQGLHPHEEANDLGQGSSLVWRQVVRDILVTERILSSRVFQHIAKFYNDPVQTHPWNYASVSWTGVGTRGWSL